MKYYLEIFKAAKITAVHSKLKEFIEGKDIDIIRFDLLNEKTTDLSEAFTAAQKAMSKDNLKLEEDEQPPKGNEWVIIIMYAKIEDYQHQRQRPIVVPFPMQPPPME